MTEKRNSRRLRVLLKVTNLGRSMWFPSKAENTLSIWQTQIKDLNPRICTHRISVLSFSPLIFTKPHRYCVQKERNCYRQNELSSGIYSAFSHFRPGGQGRHVPYSAPGLPVLWLLQYPKLQLLSTDVAWTSNIMLDILIFHVHLQLHFGLPRWLSW